jgi:hypothetical protein
MARRATTELIAQNNGRLCGSCRLVGGEWRCIATDADGRVVESATRRTMSDAEEWLRTEALAITITRCPEIL